MLTEHLPYLSYYLIESVTISAKPESWHWWRYPRLCILPRWLLYCNNRHVPILAALDILTTCVHLGRVPTNTLLTQHYTHPKRWSGYPNGIYPVLVPRSNFTAWCGGEEKKGKEKNGEREREGRRKIQSRLVRGDAELKQ